MKFAKLIVAGLLVPALVSPAFAAGDRAVRPSVKAVSPAPAAQDRALTVRKSARAGAETEDQMFLAGAPLLAVVAVLLAAGVLAVAGAGGGDGSASPGS